MSGTTENRKVYISINGKEVKNTYRGIKAEVLALTGQLTNTTRGTKEFEQATKKLDNAKKQFEKVKTEVGFTRKGISGLNDNFNALKNTFIVVAAINVFGKILKDAFELRKEMGKLEAVLKNALGDDLLAEGAITMIEDFATETPFSVQQLTESFVKLVNRGIIPTREEMRKMGDFSSATGKSFDQLAEAILDAQTGEFERLKEFGIMARREGDGVAMTFKGQRTQIAMTKDAITEYIYSLGDLEGVSGSMAAISNELAGATSNLGDAYDTLLNTIFKNDTALTRFMKTMTTSLQVLKESIRAGGVLGVDEVAEINAEAEENLKRSLDRIKKEAGTNKEVWKDWEGRVKTAITSVDERLKKDNYTPAARLRLIKVRENYLQILSSIKEVLTVDSESNAKLIKERAEAQKKIEALLLKAAGSEEDIIRAKYEELIALAKKYKIDLVDDLTEQMNSELIDAIQEQALKEIDAENKKQQEKLKAEEEFQRERREALERYELLDDNERHQMALDALDVVYEKKLLSLEEYLEAKKFLEDEHANGQTEKQQEAFKKWVEELEAKLEKQQAFTNAFSNLVNTMVETEMQGIRTVEQEDYEVNQRRGESDEAFQKRKAEAEKKYTAAKKEEERERHAISKKYAFLQAMANVAQIGSETALAIVKALADLGPIAGPIAAAIIGTTGVLQAGIALQNANKIQGYATGGFTDNATGPVDETGFRQAGIVHEEEWVAPRWMRKSPRYASTINALEYARANNVGRYGNTSTPVAISSTPSGPVQATLDTGNFNKAVLMLSETVDKLVERGVLAVADDDFERAMKEKRERDELIINNSRI
tara:strand:- start:26125 stop:28605 length:2481 start_codon:yes stop_codon:yes gene_type:complete